MARSNNQDRTAPPTGRQTRPPQAVEHGLPWNTGPAAPGPLNEPQFGYDPQDQDSAYGTQPPGQPPGGAQLPWPPQAPGQSGYPQGQGYPQGYSQSAPPQPGYPHPAASHLAQYLPQAGSSYPPDPAAQQRGGYTPQEAHFAQTPSSQGPQGQPAGPGAYQHNSAYPPQPASHDPHGYEFGAYATQSPGASSGHTGGYPMGQPGQPANYTTPPTGRPAVAYGQPHAPQYDQGFGASQGDPRLTRAPQVNAEPHGTDEDFDDDYEDEEEDVSPPRRFGVLKIAASLVVAISLGAGAAYGYRVYAGKSPNRPPVVLKAETGPSKTMPQTASLTDEKLADDKSGARVNDAMPDVVATGEGTVDNTIPAGARRVQTIPIAPSAGPSAPGLRPTMSMPGLTVEGLPPSSPSAPSQAAPQRTVMSPPVATSPAGRGAPIAPHVVASLDPPPVQAPRAPAKAVFKRTPVAKAPKVEDAFAPGVTAAAAVATAATTPAAAPAKPGANGYIAVLFSSQGSAVDARKALDAIQGKYSEVLAGKPTDVTEATVKGQLWYRAIVGPPGSRSAANTVCTQLKTAGLKDCFVTAY